MFSQKKNLATVRRVTLFAAMLLLAALACNAPDSGADLAPVNGQQGTGQVVQPTPISNTGENIPDTQIDLIMQAAVQIIAADVRNGRLEPLWTGSGTIISPSGEIITNCHVACGAPVLEIRMTTDPALPPEPAYLAEITHYDEDLDLALLQIVTDENGNATTPSNLPYLQLGNSDGLRLGDPVRVFGYPGVGGETITFTSGSVSGFESAVISGQEQRVVVKTDAGIASGNSGGTAVDSAGRLVGIPTWVNPDVRDGVTIGGIGVLRPVNLINVVRQQVGAPSAGGAAELPPVEDPDAYEPNDSATAAVGPLTSGETISAYISWEGDLDFYYFTVNTQLPITVQLNNIPSGTDYDLYLLDQNDVVAFSESETTQELVEYTPSQRGTYWVAVASYSGANTSAPYSLTVIFDGATGGGSSAGGSGTINVSGRAVDANTGRALPGGAFGILRAGTSCNQFFGAANPNYSLVVVSTETNFNGYFDLAGVPVGQTYTTFFVYGTDYICENNWLDVPGDAIDSDLGNIEMDF